MLHNRIKEFRKHSGTSQQELASFVGVSRNTIGSIESGKLGCTVETAIKISEFFSLPVDSVFYMSED